MRSKIQPSEPGVAGAVPSDDAATSRRWQARPRRSPLRDARLSIVLILVLALALRLLLWSQPLHQLANDEVEYVTVARDLLAGRGWQFYEHYHWLRAPLYTLFLAGSLWLAGGDPTAADALHRAALPNIALSVATVYLCYRLTLALVGRRAAMLAAVLTTILWTLANFASLYMAETLFTFLFTAGLLCLVQRPARWRWPPIGLAGVCFGLATLTRSITLVFLPVVALWLLLRAWHDWWPATRSAQGDAQKVAGAAAWPWFLGICLAPIVFLLSAMLTIAPWTIHNQLAYGRAILVETGLSYNLWAFNEPREDQETIFRTLENIPNPAVRSDYATAKGLARLREDPAILWRKLWPGWIYLWRVKAIEDRFIQESYYGDVGLPSFVAALLLDDLLGLLIALAGFAGLVLHWSPAPQRDSGLLRRLLVGIQHPDILMAAWVGYAIATTMLTHAETRYRHFLYPILIPYAAWLLSQAGRSREPARWPLASREQVISIALLWTLLGAVWLIYYPRDWAEQNLARDWHASAAELFWQSGWPDAALYEDERALAVHATPDGWMRLGDHARALGDTRRALSAYREAVALTPPYVAAVARLGDLRRSLGDDSAARRAFVGDYVDQQRLVEWSWRELRPPPRAFLDVGDGLDFGYVGGVYTAEQQQGASARRTRGQAFVRLGEANGAEAGPATLRLRLAAPRPDATPAQVQVCALGRCQALSVGAAWRTYMIPIARVSGELLVEIRSDTFPAPDGRRFGVLIDWAERE